MMLWVLSVLCLLASNCLCTYQQQQQTKKNVLFLVSDDMRPQLGVYQGSPDFPDPTSPAMYTPNLDGLARKSLLLKRAYVQQAVCSPSRTSLLTGRRPDTTRVYDLQTYFRKETGNFTTIPQYFKMNGYLTAGMGKIFHPGQAASGGDDPISWTEKYYHASAPYYNKYSSVTWRMIPKSDWSKHPLNDMMVANHAVKLLQNVSAKALRGEQPFFIAVGFHRPHLPFVVPDKYFDHYPIEKINPPSNPYAPEAMPEIAWSVYDEMRHYPDIGKKYGYGAINGTFYPNDVVLDLRRAYYAAVTYVDDLVGQVLKELDDLGLANSTVVSFWGDHGWQLGEHGEWCKHTNFEVATHAPMIVHVPGLTDQGVVTEQLTEFVDLFPTLVEAAGLDSIPLCPKENASKVETCTEGVSFLPLAEDPEQAWKTAVFSQYPRMTTWGDRYMGYSMRTDKYRFTAWVNFHGYPGEPNWGLTYRNGYELYDHVNDPQENINLAKKTEYKSMVKQLTKQLKEGWRAALPTLK